MKYKGIFFILFSISICFGICSADELPSIDEALSYAISTGEYSSIEVENVLDEYVFYNDGEFDFSGSRFIIFERLDAEGVFEESKISCFDPGYQEKRTGETRLFLRNDLMLLMPPQMRAASINEADIFIISETYYTLDYQIIHSIYDDNGSESLPQNLEDPEALMNYLLLHPRVVKEYSYKPLYSVYAIISLYDVKSKAGSVVEYQYYPAPLDINNPKAEEQWNKMVDVNELIISLQEMDAVNQKKEILELIDNSSFQEDTKNIIKNWIETSQYADALDYLESYFWQMAEDLSAMDTSKEALKWYPQIIETRDTMALEQFVKFRNYNGIDTPDSEIIEKKLYIAEVEHDWLEQELISIVNIFVQIITE